MKRLMEIEVQQFPMPLMRLVMIMMIMMIMIIQKI